ncbi:hypothetical protein Nmel_009610 [Mimus melanotis]
MGTSAAMATSAAMLPPCGCRKCVTALAPAPRGQTPSPSNRADGSSRGPTGQGRSYRTAGDTDKYRATNSRPERYQLSPVGRSALSVHRPSRPSIHSWLLRPLRRCAGQPGAARSGGAQGSRAPAARKAPGVGSGGIMSVSEMFAALQGALGQDQDIREEIRKVVQALEQTAREILTLLQGVHQGPGFQHISKKCQKAREHFGTVRTQMESLKTKFPILNEVVTFVFCCCQKGTVPGNNISKNKNLVSSDLLMEGGRENPGCLWTTQPGKVWELRRFHEHWRFVLQRLVFLAAFVVYLESETLVTREAVAEILGIEADRERGFHLDIEDYLSGVLTLASELARLAVNSVTAGDYSRPLRISTFINELDSGFRLLNLKNDSLRKRYDGLKYDVKKIEEVVYDLSIRGLNKEATVSAGGEK